MSLVRALPAGSVVVSGGCRGVDRWAAEAARARGLEVLELLPDLAGVKSRGQAASRFFARNKRIVDAADVCVAFPAPDRKGGTENTIAHAHAKGIPVRLL